MTKIVDAKIVASEPSSGNLISNSKFFDLTIDYQPNAESDALIPVKLESKDVATLSFTSGSTGVPKIVPLTHFNIVETANSLRDFGDLIKQGDIFHGFLPMYHVLGIDVEILLPLIYHGGLLLQASINPRDLMADLQKYQPHIIPAVPRLWEMFRNQIIAGLKEKKVWPLANFVINHQKLLRTIGLGKLVKKIRTPILATFGGRARLLLAGGAATKPHVEAFYRNLGLHFILGYGLTETVGSICISFDNKKLRPFAIGRMLSNNECQIRDKNEAGAGELWVRGHSVFGGYLNNDSLNAEVFDAQGFFNTGDVVTQAADGMLHFHARKKQVIVLDSGKNVYPSELESAYLDLPGVKNIAVFEHVIRDKTVVYGVFQIAEGVTIDQIADSVNTANINIPSYKQMTYFAVTTEALPATSTGKTKHYVVRENLIKGQYPDRKE
jgi:long-chain acyl-CoA synthetase